MDWQTVISLVIVGAAVVVFFKQLVRSESGCSDCQNCPAHDQKTTGLKVTPLVQLDRTPE